MKMIVSRDKSIDQELDELTSIYVRGGGFGSPEAERELERRIDLLKHRQIQTISRKNTQVAMLNVFLTALNIGVLIYQVFFR